MAQWAREAQQPCLLPSASITNRGKQRKGRTGRERLPLYLQSSTATRQLPGILFCSRTLEGKKILPDVQLLRHINGFTLTGVNGNQNQQQITRTFIVPFLGEVYHSVINAHATWDSPLNK